MNTHERFIQGVADIVANRLPSQERAKLDGIKLVYGAGQSGLRGVTYYNKWKPGQTKEARPFVEVCAFGQSSWVQLAGTTIHELAHVVAGHGAGHSKDWKETCELLGLRCAKAVGMVYNLAALDPSIRAKIAALPRPNEGEPVVDLGLGGLGLPLGFKLKPCGAGIGSRGGKSRGVGSGSRMRKYVCECEPPVIIRAASDTLACHCDHCSTAFTRA